MGELLIVVLLVLLIFVISRKRRPIRHMSVEEAAKAHEILTGERCHICGERFVGLAMDCRCTNWGE